MIYLIGFMGCGKTSTGIELACLLGCPFLDTDQLIVDREGMSIPDIFAKEGERGFRKIETAVFRDLSGDTKDAVVSCGGGAVLRDENVILMKKSGRVIRLSADARTVYDRVKGDSNRPLLMSPDPLSRIRELMAEREEAYSRASDITVATDGLTPAEVASRILAVLTK
ncbi:MAG: shikimate kinase [Lachnospiraceae bacterium]|nr:shikimate kinase [Lachnospiraceae bacterium]